jgi:hypothetical protein|tara:strand:+ start:144 stop:497 length:354 start_codon:yes stop_codon:yes gene_type:complete
MNEEESIKQTIQHYINGARSGKGEEMKPAFHGDATIFGYIGDDLFSGHIQKLYDWNDNNGPAIEISCVFKSIEIVESIATVCLESKNWTGYDFTDFFTLLKVNGDWKIINKVFHLHQ